MTLSEASVIYGSYPVHAVVLVATAICVSGLLTMIAIRLAPMLGFLDRPDGGRKRHEGATPLLGGVAVLAALLTSIALLPEASATPQTELIHSQFMMALGTTASMLCVLGLFDDRFGMRARFKFLGQVIAVLPFVVWGCQVETVDVLGLGIHLGPTIGFAFAMFWLVSCTNAINLMDGLDGLASSIGLIAAVTIGVIALITGQSSAAMLAFAFAGAIAGFLFFNRPPAKVFLGDSGSMTIGFVVGALALGASVKKATGFALVVPLVLVSVPAFDTFMAIVRRKLSGQSMGDPDRRHLHHRLKDRGFSDTKVLLLISTVCLGMAGGAIAATLFDADWIAVASCMVLLGLLMLNRVFGHEEARLAIRHAQTIALWWTGSVQNLRPKLAMTRLEVSHGDADKFWNECRQRVQQMGGFRLTLNFDHVDGSTQECSLLDLPVVGRAGHQPVATWELRYTTQADEGSQATLVAWGERRAGDATQLDDLYRVFEGACQRWAIENSAAIPLPAIDAQPTDTPARRAA